MAWSGVKRLLIYARDPSHDASLQNAVDFALVDLSKSGNKLGSVNRMCHNCKGKGMFVYTKLSVYRTTQSTRALPPVGPVLFIYKFDFWEAFSHAAITA